MNDTIPEGREEGGEGEEERGEERGGGRREVNGSLGEDVFGCRLGGWFWERKKREKRKEKEKREREKRRKEREKEREKERRGKRKIVTNMSKYRLSKRGLTSLP